MSGLILSLRASSAGAVHPAAKSTALWLLLAVLASESRLCSARLSSSLGLQTRTQDCPIGQEAWAGDRVVVSPDFLGSGRGAAAELFGGNFSCSTAAWGPRKCMDSGQAAAAPGSQQDGAIGDKAKGAAAGAQASGDNNREREVPETKDPETQTEEAAAEDRQEISCKDHNGANVDWFFAIKLSRLRRLIYVASNGADGGWIQVDDVGYASPVSNTFDQEKTRDTTRSKLFLYNDHPPGQAARTSGAHMKGVILQGPGIEDSGFWMLHSVPQFPNVDWPNIDGQSFFCVTLNRREIEIVKNLVHELSADFSHTFHYRRDDRSEYQTLKTRNDVPLHINAKQYSTANDIYNLIKVDESYLSKVQVQTYRLGASPPLPSNENVTNVAATKFLQNENRPYDMLFSQDNSKWSIGEIPVADRESRKFFCAGDLDRVEAHLKRSGCLVCMENPRLWGLLDAAIGRVGRRNNQGHQLPPELPNTCKTAENQPVDWFIVVKNQGRHAYRYLSSLDDSNWQTYNGTADSPLDWTLREANAVGLSKNVYNDHIPSLKSAKSDNAHAKGVFVVGASVGFWLMHSMPQFPIITNQGEFSPDFCPKSDRNTGREDNVKNAQIFFCLTFKSSEEDNIIKQIRLMKEHTIYDNFQNPIKYHEKINFHSTRIVSYHGVELVHIAKSPEYNADVYETVSDLIGERFYVQCHTTGAGSNLTETQMITQIKETKFDTWTAVKAGSDHSKWCVAHSENVYWPYFCIGDLNRKETQKKRGGGVLCLLNTNVHRKFLEAIKLPPV